jgi:hypothetical protein
MDVTNPVQGCCEHLLRAESFIKTLLQQHFAKVADQCAVIVQQGCTELPLRHATARLLGKLQGMRGLGEQYKRQVLTEADGLSGIQALRACMRYWLADLDELIECHAVGSAQAGATGFTALLGKDQAEETYLLDLSLVRVYTEMRSASTAWLDTQAA